MDKNVLNDESYKVMSKDETLNKLKQYRENPSEELRNEIALGNTNLVYSIVSRFVDRNNDMYNDFVLVGQIALLKAVENFDISQNNAFSTYAVSCIDNSIKTFLSNSGFISLPSNIQTDIRNYKRAFKKLSAKFNRTPTDEEMSKEMNVTMKKFDKIKDYSLMISNVSFDSSKNVDDNHTLSDVIGDEYSDPKLQAIEKEEHERIEFAINNLLDEREKTVLFMYFGINCEAKTLKEIAAYYKNAVSIERIRQIKDASLNKIRKYVVEGK